MYNLRRNTNGMSRTIYVRLHVAAPRLMAWCEQWAISLAEKTAGRFSLDKILFHAPTIDRLSNDVAP